MPLTCKEKFSIVTPNAPGETKEPANFTDPNVFVTAVRHRSNFHELPHAVNAPKTYLRRSMASIRHGA
jgi:hypothetical protein